MPNTAKRASAMACWALSSALDLALVALAQRPGLVIDAARERDHRIVARIDRLLPAFEERQRALWRSASFEPATSAFARSSGEAVRAPVSRSRRQVRAYSRMRSSENERRTCSNSG